MKQAEKAAEPPSPSRPPIFMIGQDRQGHWVACEPNGSRGGLFVNRAEALRYIRSESENHLYPTIIVSGILELDLAGRKNAASSQKGGRDEQRERQVA
jgi:hypothetical protein